MSAVSNMSMTDTVCTWLRERGAGFTFVPDDVPCETLDVNRDAVSATLHTMYKEDRVAREPIRSTNSGHTTYRYTVVEGVHKPRKGHTRPKVASRNRAVGHKRNGVHPAIPPKQDAAMLVDTALTALAELQKLCAQPLAQYTNAQLIAELHRRNGADIDVRQGGGL